MRSPRRVSKLRQEIVALAAELAALQREMLRPRRMMTASLIQRRVGTRRQKCRSSAFYLSCAEGRRTRLRYVPKKDVQRVHAQVRAWKTYRAEVRRWRQLADWMGGLLRVLGQAQASRAGGGGQ